MARTASRPALAVAAALALAMVASCAEDELPPEGDPRPFPIPPPPGPLVGYGRCEDGALYHVFSQLSREDQPPHSSGAFLGRCPGACGSAVVACSNDTCSNAASALCDAPPALGKVCSIHSTSCSGTATVSCPDSAMCGGALSGSTCTCTGGTYACTRNPELAAAHASMVGKWRGAVDPPEFSQPYEVSLWIYPDGTYWSQCVQNVAPCISFYYGGDGPLPFRKITVGAASPAGALAEIGVFHGQPIGDISNLIVAGDTLTFTYRAGWLTCDQPFTFTLARE